MDYSEEQFDGLFYNILQNSKGIDNFFDSMFSFFRRKTDFYLNPEESKNKIQEKYEKHRAKFQADKDREEKRKKKEEELKKENMKRLTPTVKEISAEEAERLKKQEQEGSKPTIQQNTPSTTTTTTSTTTKPTVSTNPKKEEEKEDEGKGALPNSGNGGSAPRYVWTQKLEEVQMNIPVDPKYGGKDIIIKYKPKTLFVGIKNGETIIDGEFFASIKPDTFVWVLDSSNFSNMKNIHITFEKFDTVKWWDCVIKGDPLINTQKINPEPSKLSDLDADMRPQVEKMMFDQRQREMGLPVSDDLQKHEMMQKFMKAHPDMDFSKAKMG